MVRIIQLSVTTLEKHYSSLTICLVGISQTSHEEAQKLPDPTLPISGTDMYLIELDVWHELHCLNDLRMLLYPERFPGLEELRLQNGTIDRNTDSFRQWGG